MAKPVKRKLIIFVTLFVYYVVLSYLPSEVWFGERGFLIARILAFAPAVSFLIFAKHFWEIEIERPHIQLKYLFLLPLLIFCAINFLSVPIIGFGPSYEAQDVGLLMLELVADSAAAVFEDLLFVDLFICLFLDLFHFKHARLVSIFCSATLFCAAHCYIFLYPTYPGEIEAVWLVSLLQIVFIYLLTLVCGYLAIYFDSALIPVSFHFLYNASNHILFYHFYDFALSWRYVLFVSIFAVFGIFYFIALWHMSEHQAYREIKKPRKSGADASNTLQN